MRMPDLTRDEMDDAQKQVADEAASGKRGRMPAPLRAWIHSPQFGARAQKLGEFLRYDTILGAQMSELAILMVARRWTSHYEWYIHKKEALNAGLEPQIVDAIAARTAPEFQDDKARSIYLYVTELHEKHVISAETHAFAVEQLGERGVVELVGLLGYYTLVSMTLNAFEIFPPEGEPRELEN
ncbi:carboxymuconolactone decarboxylase family protein [Agrobacterium sp. T29]|uniref:carboxymuconolactone decarboxylase family protein n=1 Tax=Agrobacterium sp. T29 TaxID=2580515 RepID=UPI00115EC37D|nr:carboxymuconolactone decarboxylase family protein [Agrobacterium sp. T29]